MKLAKDEFTWVFLNSEDERLKYNAQLALSNLNQYEKSSKYQGQGNNFTRWNLR
jgi:hypothetical protein